MGIKWKGFRNKETLIMLDNYSYAILDLSDDHQSLDDKQEIEEICIEYGIED